MSMDLSDLEALMGGSAADEGGGQSGGVWVVDPTGRLDDGIMRLVGKARVVADALGGYVYLLACADSTALDESAVQPAIHAGADRVLLAQGLPQVKDLADFFTERGPQAVLFPRTYWGRVLGPGLAQAIGGGLVAYAADLAVDSMTQRMIAYQPLLEDAARQALTIVLSPAVAVVDTAALPAAFSEPWRSGQVEETGLVWAAVPVYAPAALPVRPVTLANAPVVVAGGRGLKNEAGFALVGRLAAALGGVAAGDVAALDAGWVDEAHLLDLTGQTAAPGLYVALGIEGDNTHLMAVQNAGAVVAVQPDPAAPITAVADWNVLADPAEFAAALLEKLGA
jgi:electron transfer flavoprotein alpha subunit